MLNRSIIAAAISLSSIVGIQGCAVTRDQETVGAYIDDATITTQVKAKFVDAKDVDASAIKVETLNGTVMLSGFAKNANEKMRAEEIAKSNKGVKAVKNGVVVRS